MRRKRVSHATSAANSSKRRSAAGSRSMQTSVPAGPRRSATSRAWPPAPKVQSIAVSPGAGAVRSISSPARTGMWTRLMSRRIAKALGHLPDLGVEGLLLGLPALPRPHLEVVPHPDHHHLLLDARVREERRRKRHATARVEIELEGVPLEEARQLAVLRPHRVQPAERALDDRLVRLRGPDRDAGLGLLGENGAVGERGSKPGRDAEPLLRVQRVLVVASECQRSCPCACDKSRPEWRSGRSPATPVDCLVPRYPTFSHLATPFPTFPSDRPPPSCRSAPVPLWRAESEGEPGGGHDTISAIPVAPDQPRSATQTGLALLQGACESKLHPPPW